MALDYAAEDHLVVDEMVDIFRRSGLAERRPIDDRSLMARMAAGANLIVTARDNGRMVGLARSVTDFAYCVYLSDLATDRTYQGQGIGRRLIDMTRQAAGAKANLILVSAPNAMAFYDKIGLENVKTAWVKRA